jgi:hypothetical protein
MFFLCHSIDLKFLNKRRVLFCVSMFSCHIFRFLRLGVVSLLSDLIWHLVSVRGDHWQAIFLLVLHWKLIRAPDSKVKILSTGLQKPRTGTLSIFKNVPSKNAFA